MKKLSVILFILFIIMAHGFVGGMDSKLKAQEETWKTSIQAIELQQEKIQADIIATQELLYATEKRTVAQGILLGEIWDRLHLDFFLAAEAGELE